MYVEPLYKKIQQVLVFVLDLLNVPQDESTTTETKRLFSQAMVTSLYDAIVSNYLERAIPVEYSLLASFDTVNKSTQQFNGSLKQLGM
jgi:hypothetical protein